MSTLSFLNIDVMGLAQLVGAVLFKNAMVTILILVLIRPRLGERSGEGQKKGVSIF